MVNLPLYGPLNIVYLYADSELFTFKSLFWLITVSFIYWIISVERILNAKTVTAASPMAPSCGLYLGHVKYDLPWEEYKGMWFQWHVMDLLWKSYKDLSPECCTANFPICNGTCFHVIVDPRQLTEPLTDWSLIH